MRASEGPYTSLRIAPEMLRPEGITLIPWDSQVFGLNCYEIVAPTEQAFKFSQINSGHYTVRVPPTQCKKRLHEYGYYYCDSLFIPTTSRKRFAPFVDPSATLVTSPSLQDLAPICNNAFLHYRFHKDFNIPNNLADTRYKVWLTSLLEDSKVYGLAYESVIVGFMATDQNNIVLHALHENHRGRGIAKFLWSLVCTQLFNEGHTSINSSISATNLAALNLYVSLGFRFSTPLDVYHRFTP